MNDIQVSGLVEGILDGDRVALSRAITLVESTRADDREPAAQLLTACLPHAPISLRIGITGPPGVGKSTFIEAVGTKFVHEGRRVAVLAVDPTSTISRGSILGDKTRMQRLSVDENAFIRPSPSGGTAGGIALRTRETIVLVEAAGYDTVFVETVGVGQSETAVHTMVDFFLFLALAGAGDELQGIKRGVVEMADGVAVTKADGKNVDAARRACSQLRNALELFPTPPSGWKPQVHTCSAVTGEGLDRISQTILEYEVYSRASGYFESRRKSQAQHWFHQAVDIGIRERFFANPEIDERRRELDEAVMSGRISATVAAEELLALWQSGSG